VTNDYLTVEQYANQYSNYSTEYSPNDPQLTRPITGWSRWIDMKTLRDPGDFNTEGNSAATRYFDGKGNYDILLIDECTSITTVQQADYPYSSYRTMTADTDYWKSDCDRYDTTPYRMLELNPNSSSFAYWPKGRRAVKISAVWGYSTEPPGPIVEAMLMLVHQTYMMRDGVGTGTETVFTNFGMVVPAAIPAKAMELIRAYKRGPL
jgi:hypothetical protein